MAVHGLNPSSNSDEDHAFNTWRKSSGDHEKLWLRDNLPGESPEARVLLYIYNASLFLGGERGRFVDQANMFLEDLRLERTKVKPMTSMAIFSRLKLELGPQTTFDPPRP